MSELYNDNQMDKSTANNTKDLKIVVTIKISMKEYYHNNKPTCIQNS